MRILRVHNYYQQAGGEDLSHAAEIELLLNNGHVVEQLHVYNSDIKSKVQTAIETIWSVRGYKLLKEKVLEFKPDAVHFDNFFPLISPAAFFAVKKLKIPVIITLRNYRLICLNAFLLRNHNVCEICLNNFFAYNGVIKRCYRNSLLGSFTIALMITVHKLIGTWNTKVDSYIVLTNFARLKFIEAGFPPQKISVKPNFVIPDPGEGQGAGNYAVFVGRLSQEKGISTLLSVWQNNGDLPILKIIGNGPLLASVLQSTKTSKSNIEYLGQKSNIEVLNIIGNAMFLLFPSLCYEGMPRTILEAFAKGTPVIASDIGAASEMITNNINGFLFRKGDCSDFLKKILIFMNSNIPQLREHSRQTYLSNYTPAKNIKMLLDIYNNAISTIDDQ